MSTHLWKSCIQTTQQPHHYFWTEYVKHNSYSGRFFFYLSFSPFSTSYFLPFSSFPLSFVVRCLDQARGIAYAAEFIVLFLSFLLFALLLLIPICMEYVRHGNNLNVINVTLLIAT